MMFLAMIAQSGATITIGTACSGCDIVVLFLIRLLGYWRQQYGSEADIEHVFAVASDVHVADLLRENAMTSLLVANALESVSISHLPRVDIFSWSLPTRLPLANENGSEEEVCADQMDAIRLQWLEKGWHYVKSRSPLLFIFEADPAFLRTPHFDMHLENMSESYIPEIQTLGTWCTTNGSQKYPDTRIRREAKTIRIRICA